MYYSHMRDYQISVLFVGNLGIFNVTVKIKKGKLIHVGLEIGFELHTIREKENFLIIFILLFRVMVNLLEFIRKITIVMSMDNNYSNMNPITSVSNQEGSENADNPELDFDPKQIFLAGTEKDSHIVLKEIGNETIITSDEEVVGVTSVEKKKWKRVTRKLPNSILAEEDQVPYSTSGKRISSIQIEWFDFVKKANVI